jgi:pimeloyl-ACP methyl ester carboxylesterase
MNTATGTPAHRSAGPLVADMSVDTGKLRLSGRIAGPRTTHRGLIIALHGGTYDSAYYDSGPDSLLELGALLGYLVIALDRPGYGAAQHADPAHLSFAAQARVLSAAVEKIVEDYGIEGGAVLAGHSVGGMIALCVAAATDPGGTIAAVQVSGVGERWQPGPREEWSSMIGDVPSVTVPVEVHGQAMFGPPGTYSTAQQARDAELIRPLPMPELIDVVAWADTLPLIAAKVALPVSLTLAEHDRFWQSDAGDRAAISGRFTASPSVQTEQFAGAGHSIELHRNARAYCLRQLSYAEQWLSA